MLRGVVVGIYDVPENQQSLSVAIRPYQAVFTLDKGNPQFDEWLAILRESANNFTEILFEYVDDRQQVVSVQRQHE